ncbi:MAG: response regulator [Candidatus Syntrophosphaera sp.]|nr:response regulator [Candidatus Syntrophosphaera sp.]
MSFKILLVDDDILLRELIGEFLFSGGYEVDVAENGNKAIKLFEPGKYGLALLDQDIKQISGVKLMKQLRKLDKNLFCLIMTGYSSLDKVSAAIEEGNSDLIIKPFAMPELLNILQKYV